MTAAQARARTTARDAVHPAATSAISGCSDDAERLAAAGGAVDVIGDLLCDLASKLREGTVSPAAVEHVVDAYAAMVTAKVHLARAMREAELAEHFATAFRKVPA